VTDHPRATGRPIDKTELRRALVGARRARSATDRIAAATRNSQHLAAVLSGAPVVCAFLPLPSEPLSIGLLEQLATTGTTVLVPVVASGAPLDWCRFPGPTSPGPFGIAEPSGRRLGPGAVTTATAILIPALAVDRAGRRLGRGEGHYDRALALLGMTAPLRKTAQPGTPLPQLIAVVFDDEIIAGVPVESHDVAVTAVTTPTGGLEYFRR